MGIGYVLFVIALRVGVMLTNRLCINKGIPGVLLIGAEWWSFELYALLSGWISVQALATQTILMQTTSLLFMIPLGMAVGTATIVGNRLGARLPLKAAFTVKVSVIGIFILALAFSMGIFGIRNYWGQIFTSDIEVTDSVAKYLPILCIFIVRSSSFFSIRAKGTGY
jgi:MATE family multidrug resistance protein